MDLYVVIYYITTMSFIKKIKRKDGKAYAIEVEGYRDKQGKVRHRYLRYVGTIDKEGNILPSNKEINVDKVYNFGFPFMISQTIKETGLKALLGKYGEEISSLVLMHLVAPSSLSRFMTKIKTIDPELIGIQMPIDRERLESSLDYLEKHKQIIELKIFESIKAHCSDETLFYDITSIYLNGALSLLAEVGYPEFEPQINIGLCIEGGYGFPLFCEFFNGNISHKTTLDCILERFKSLQRECIIVFDAGITSATNIDRVLSSGFHVISRVPMSRRIKKIAHDFISSSMEDMIQLSNTKVYVKELNYGKGKLLVCFNEKLRFAIKERRYDEILKGLEKKSKGVPIKEGIEKYLIKEGKKWVIDYKAVKEADMYDGVYVLFCSLKGKAKEWVVRKYFERDRIEKAFNIIEEVIEIKPVRHYLDSRIKAHIMVCYLSYFIATYIDMKLKEKGLKYTIKKLKDILDGVYKLHIYKGKTLLKKINSLNNEQKQIIEIFGLLSYN